MKTKVLGLLTVLLLSFAAAAHASVEPTGKIEYFGMLDYYFRGDIDKKVLEDYDRAVDALGNASYDSSTTGGIGGRIGLRKPLANDRFDIGASASLVAGPRIEVNFVDNTAPPGTVHEKITTLYQRLMAEAGMRFRASERAWFRIGGAAGIGRGAAKDQFDGTGFYAGSQSTTRHDTGFVWEITPSLLIATERAKLEIGVRYAVFPKIKETSNSVALDWKTFGVFFGAAF